MKNNIVKGKTTAKFIPTLTIKNPNGEVRKYLSQDADSPTSYKEVYFSRLLPGKSKKWKYNQSQTQNLTSAMGRISIICIQPCTDGYIYEEFLIDDLMNFGVLEIPAGLIYGLFTDNQGALIVNSLVSPYTDSDAQIVSVDFDVAPTLL